MPKRLSSKTPELPEYGLRTIFGDTVRARILDFLTLYRGSEYSMSEIARNSHVSWRSFNRVFPILIKHSLVKEVGKSGRAKLYKYADNRLTKNLVSIANQVTINAIKGEIE